MPSTTSRLLALLSLLQNRRDWPGPLLAARLDVTDRTVRRDIDRLREMGYRIEATMGPEGGYRLDAGSELPPLLFDDEQVIAITIALQAAGVTGAGIEEAALRALTTMRQVMPSRLRHRLDALAFTAMNPAVGEAQRDDASPDVLLAVAAAIRATQVLRFDYRGSAAPAGNDRPPRRVEPHHLVTSGGRWYLVGWDLERDDWRIFRADRISPRIPNGPRFASRTVPGEDAARFVSARFKGSDSGDVWPCRGKVVLHLAARDVVPFAGDGVVEDLGPDRCSLEAGSWSWVALAASIGRFDTEVEVVDPPELRAAFAQLAGRNAATAASSTRSSAD